MQAFWSKSAPDVAAELQTSANGLTQAQAQQRLLAQSKKVKKPKHEQKALLLFLAQFKSPIVLILLFATALSFYVGETTDAAIIIAIVLISGVLGFLQENGANRAVQKLLALVQVKTCVLRGGEEQEIPVGMVVPGDISILHAGDVVSGDCLILESASALLDESALTGESYPVEKKAGVLGEDTGLSGRTNCVWMGTHVVSGSLKAIVVHTGKDTEFGKISERIRLRQPETDFERGVRRFGYMLMTVTLILVFSILAINLIFKKGILDAFMFSLALAVGLTPQLLPAIISINLSRGARNMAALKVIVKRLSAIENLGSMNVLCSDKTGTLTDGAVKLKDTLDSGGGHSDKTLLYVYLNAALETGFINPIDAAVREQEHVDISRFTRMDEQPYDFVRKRLSITVSERTDAGENRILITKGAFDNVLAVCTQVEEADASIAPLDAGRKEKLLALYASLSGQGLRTIGVAYKVCPENCAPGRDNEKDMVFLGYLTLYDPPKPGIADTIKKLGGMGVSLKIITGDNRFIAQNVMKEIGLPDVALMTGKEIRETNDLALIHRVNEATVFAEVEPNQKERIILALKKSGNVVGYMGDGINDVSALHDADVSISVDSAVDVAKEAADIVLLEKDLAVLTEGVLAGRRTFANTMKYVFMATSANFGNMFSMAGASIFLPFLPLLPKQVLLTNLMTDFPEMTIASDNVEPAAIEKPKRWNIGFIRRFMVVFGLVSSFFDYLTFGALLLLSHASQAQFRTGWFVESVASAALIVLVIRTRYPIFKAKPGRQLTIATLLVVALTVLLPYTPLAPLLGFTALPAHILLVIAAIIATYILTAELVKKLFYRSPKNY